MRKPLSALQVMKETSELMYAMCVCVLYVSFIVIVLHSFPKPYVKKIECEKKCHAHPHFGV